MWLSYRGGVGFPISVADNAQRRKLCGACELKRAAEMQMVEDLAVMHQEQVAVHSEQLKKLQVQADPNSFIKPFWSLWLLPVVLNQIQESDDSEALVEIF